MSSSDKNEVVTGRLTLHPAFKETIPLPVAILAHQELGLGHGQTLYLIHILAAQIRGEEINLGRIAALLGVDKRTVKKYNRQLEDMSIMIRMERYQDGRQIENAYDLDRWLSQSMSVSTNHEDRRMNELLERLRNVENLDDLQSLIGAYTPPAGGRVILRSPGGGDPTI
ncbi:MAG: hypothetical protein KC415_21610, partial [Anaerolineales bacterium]|nr:hypothetical protein [Anaerolineales bacterium]